MTHPVMCPGCHQPMDPVLPENGITTHPACIRPIPWQIPHTKPSCRFCRAPVQWALTAAGKAIPLDPGIFEDGNLAVRVSEGVRRVRFLRAGDGPWAGERRGRAHAVSCPEQTRSKT